MKGLEQYIGKYGNHFTEELALSVIDGKWNSTKISKGLQEKVYYNVTGSTLGDMVFLTNKRGEDSTECFNKCIDYMLVCIGDFNFYEKTVFDKWLSSIEDFDFTPYI